VALNFDISEVRRWRRSAASIYRSEQYISDRDLVGEFVAAHSLAVDLVQGSITTYYSKPEACQQADLENLRSFLSLNSRATSRVHHRLRPQVSISRRYKKTFSSGHLTEVQE